MPSVRLAALLCIACALLVAPVAAPARPAAAPQTLWTAMSGTAVYAAPAPTAGVLARLPGNQPLRVTPSVGGWAATLLWNALPAWVLLARLAPRPAIVGYSYAAPYVPHPSGPHAPMSLAARGRLDEPAFLRAGPTFSAARLTRLPRGTRISIDAWATDAGGAAWYHTSAARAEGWVYGDAVTFEVTRPTNADAPLAPLRGKGLWFTYPLLVDSPAGAIVRAAQAAGLTHLYVEVGRSPSGFYGGPGLAALLPLAHRAGIRVIAWVYPYLEHVPDDVAMSVAAARYTAPTGDRPDGLLADVEEVTAEGAVRAYGQVLRAILGPDEPMAVATFPPQSPAGQGYPFATEALSWNAIVPMDYWHLRRRPYGAAEVYRYVAQSVRLIRAQTGPAEPVEVLGQMFDPYQSGVNSPGAAEIAACAAAARDSGAVGVSFFEWNHATPEEWGALAALPGSVATPRRGTGAGGPVGLGQGAS